MLEVLQTDSGRKASMERRIGLRKGVTRLLPLLAASAVALSACSTSPYAAIVNGQRVSVSSLNTELAQVSANKSFLKQIQSSQGSIYGTGKGTYSSAFTAQILNRRVSVILVDQELAHLHLRVGAQQQVLALGVAESGFGGAAVFSQFPPSYRAQLIQDTAAIDTLEAHLVGRSLTVGAIGSYYHSHQAALTEYCASQIVTSTQAQAAALRKTISGGTPFASVAQASSQDPSTAANGGAIGCGMITDYQEALGSSFASTVGSLAVNTVSQPVQVPAGYALIEVTSKGVPPESSVVAVIVNSILGSQGQSLLGLEVQRLARAAKITINPTYGSMSVTAGRVGVVPPKASAVAAKGFFKTPKPG